MQKEILLELLAQNKKTCFYAFDRITEQNVGYRLNEKTASVGFIYRHIGEAMNLFGSHFGIPTEIQNTTMGEQDSGQHFDLGTSRLYVEQGYEMLKTLIENVPDAARPDPSETPLVGTASIAHILFHNSHHAGQISLTLSKGQ